MNKPVNKPDPKNLTARQRRILEVIRDAVVLRGYPPSIREIGDAAGLQSTSSVAYQLKELEVFCDAIRRNLGPLMFDTCQMLMPPKLGRSPAGRLPKLRTFLRIYPHLVTFLWLAPLRQEARFLRKKMLRTTCRGCGRRRAIHAASRGRVHARCRHLRR